MSGIFSINGKLVSTLGKAADAVMLSAVWLLCCLPIVTILPASAALYYACVKSLRRERGHALRQFWHALRMNLKQGVVLNLILLALAAVVWEWLIFAARFPLESVEGLVYTAISRGLLLVVALGVVFLPALLSRFTMSVWGFVKYSYFLAVRHFGTLLFLMAALVGSAVMLYAMPLFLMLLPAGLALVSSCAVEPVFKKYTASQPDQDAWYLEEEDKCP